MNKAKRQSEVNSGSGQADSLSKELTDELAGFAAGYISPGQFDEIIELLQREISRFFFPRSSESNLLRIFKSVYGRATFLKDFLRYPHYAEVITAIAANSNYLTDIVVRNPEYLYRILDSSYLDMDLDEEKFRKSIRTTLGSFKSFEAKANAMRTIKRRELLRTGVRDILGFAPLLTVTHEISITARVLAAELFNLCFHEKMGGTDYAMFNDSYCLAALGKLGGGELNYSSDIDLIIFYDDQLALPEHRDFDKLLTETVHLFVERASAITENGFLFRVDFRLRPDGRAAPLTRSLQDYLNYYETRGEDWERQMLIKAGFVTGSRTLFKKFTSYLSHFIFPKTFLSSPLDQIKRLRGQTLSLLKNDKDIKQSLGGIRDIEFSVQALQLLNGGRNPQLRTGHTMEAIARLKQLQLLSEAEAETLLGAYTLFRRIEHYLQLMNDAQTHEVPESGELLNKLSSYLGFASSRVFGNTVQKMKQEVAAVYRSVLEIETDEEEDKLQLVRFTDEKRAKKDYTFLEEGKGLLGQKGFDSHTLKAFRRIENTLIEYLHNSHSPDRVLHNFVRIIQASRLHSVWYESFQQEKVFEAFLQVCEKSQVSVDLFAEDALLKDIFLSGEAFEPVSSEQLGLLSPKQILFILSVQFALRIASRRDAARALAQWLRKKTAYETEAFIYRQGESCPFFVAAMGSFATGEMKFSSDADLVFVGENIERFPDIQRTFLDFFQELTTSLRPVEIDCRLRPEGKSSLLLWDISSYEAYLTKRAAVWEMQALCKIEFVAGDRKLFDRFITMVEDAVENLNHDKLKKDMLDMRSRLYPKHAGLKKRIINFKKSRGGLQDIEFLLQWFLLRDVQLYSQSRTYDPVDALPLLKQRDLLPAEAATTLAQNYEFLKELEMRNEILFNTGTHIIPSDADKLCILASEMQLASERELNERIQSIIKSNAGFFDRYLKDV